jgi:hypothetical protein
LQHLDRFGLVDPQVADRPGVMLGPSSLAVQTPPPLVAFPVVAEFQDLLMLLAEHGFNGMAQVLQLLFNEAMKLERAAKFRCEMG